MQELSSYIWDLIRGHYFCFDTPEWGRYFLGGQKVYFGGDTFQKKIALRAKLKVPPFQNKSWKVPPLPILAGIYQKGGNFIKKKKKN